MQIRESDHGVNTFQIGDIAELLMIRGTVSDGELNLLEVYLMSKYGLL